MLHLYCHFSILFSFLLIGSTDASEGLVIILSHDYFSFLLCLNFYRNRLTTITADGDFCRTGLGACPQDCLSSAKMCQMLVCMEGFFRSGSGTAEACQYNGIPVYLNPNIQILCRFQFPLCIGQADIEEAQILTIRL